MKRSLQRGLDESDFSNIGYRLCRPQVNENRCFACGTFTIRISTYADWNQKRDFFKLLRDASTLKNAIAGSKKRLAMNANRRNSGVLY